MDHATAEVVNLRPLAAEVRVQSQATLREQSGNGTSCVSSTSVLHCHYNYTKLPHSILH